MPPILQLPVELFSTILSMLDDLPSLQSAILTSRAFNNAFQEEKLTVLSGVLAKYIGADAIPAALAAIEAQEAATTSQFTPKDIQTFCAEHLQNRAPVPSFNALGKVIAVAKLSATVKAFTKRFAQYVVATSPTEMSTLTATERTRVERAFYFFETFCTLFRNAPRDSGVFLGMDNFFAIFCPWELEQLGCIHDFLFHQVQPGYDDIVYHDVTWGAIEVEPAMNIASPEIQAILSSGLASIYRLATAETYEARHKLLYTWGGPPQNNHFFYQGLALQHLPTRWPRFPLYRDPDPGPRHAWKWAYAGCPPRSNIYRTDRVVLRSWGYVFYDQARLDDMALLDKPFDPPLLPPERHEVSDEFAATWWVREEISRAGGTGYWTPTDQSQVIYPVASRRGHQMVGRRFAMPSFANAKRELVAESARIEAAMQSKKKRTEGS